MCMTVKNNGRGCLYVSECVCVCVRERERGEKKRERERERGGGEGGRESKRNCESKRITGRES